MSLIENETKQLNFGYKNGSQKGTKNREQYFDFKNAAPCT